MLPLGRSRLTGPAVADATSASCAGRSGNAWTIQANSHSPTMSKLVAEVAPRCAVLEAEFTCKACQCKWLCVPFLPGSRHRLQFRAGFRNLKRYTHGENMQSRLAILALLLALVLVPANGLAHQHDSLSTLDCGLCHVGHLAVGVECTNLVLQPSTLVRQHWQPTEIWLGLDPLLAASPGRAPPSILQ